MGFCPIRCVSVSGTYSKHDKLFLSDKSDSKPIIFQHLQGILFRSNEFVIYGVLFVFFLYTCNATYQPISTVPVTPSKPYSVDTTKRPRLTTQQLQIPGHRAKTIGKDDPQG